MEINKIQDLVDMALHQRDVKVLSISESIENLPKKELYEHYYYTCVLFKKVTTLDKWIIRRLYDFKNNIVICYRRDDVDRLTGFKNSIYEGITKDSFEDISSRVLLFNEDDLTKDESVNGIILLDSRAMLFGRNIFKDYSELYPNSSFLLGLN